MVSAQVNRIVCTRRRAAPAALLAAGLCLALAMVSRAEGAGPFFRIGTGSEAGSGFAIGEALAGVLQDALSTEACPEPPCPELPRLAVAQLSNGSVANVRALESGRLEAALVAAHVQCRSEVALTVSASNPKLVTITCISAIVNAARSDWSNNCRA